MKQKFRKSVFVVVYSREKNKIEYLILKRKLHWKGWEFPKGGIETGEKISEAIKREVREETGLKILRIKKFDVKGKFRYDKKFSDRPGISGQEYWLYAVEVKKGRIKLDKREHSCFKWLKFSDAVKKLTWKNQQKCLKIVNEWLRE